MPNGTGLGIAKGIEQGTNNFLQSFFAARQYRDQAKYRKLQPQIDAVNAVINDPDTPLKVKIQSMDSLPHILGSYKQGDIPLSEHLGLNKLANEDVVTKEAKIGSGVSNPDYSQDPNVQATAQNAPAGTDPDRASYGAASAQFQKDSTPEIKKRGDLSANDFKNLQAAKMEKLRDEDVLTREIKVAQVKSRMEEALLAKKGFDRTGDVLVDQATGDYVQSWYNNATQEQHIQRFPKGMIPVKILEDQIKNEGVPAAVKTLRQFVADSKGLEVTNPEVIKVAGELGKKAYGLKITAGEQRTTEGGVPKTAAQIADDNRADIEVKTKRAKLEAQAEAQSNYVKRLGIDKTELSKHVVEAERVKNAYISDNELSTEDLPGDKNYQTANNTYLRLKATYDKKVDEFNKAVKDDEEFKKQLSSPRNDNIPASKEGQILNPDSPTSNNYPQPVLDLIKQVRDKNRGTKKTDKEIYQELVKAGIIITK